MCIVSIQYIERLLVLALNKGITARRSGITESDQDRIEERKSVAFYTKKLDALHCSWSTQNNALYYINNVNEDQPLYESLYKRSLHSIATDIDNGLEPYNKQP
ncbi:MAG: hypothetical protein L3J59_10395 [Methylococcaceae bacterium]|nr:hypothetical protein [Methylococcaceae bacterium]